MINFFDFATNDKSLVWMQSLFGTMNGILKTPDGSGGAITVLSTMFGMFNSVILAIAVLMVVYVTVVGIMVSAQEGESMGKEWNSLWVPIRVVLGMAALVPTGTGYCAIQLLMMWVIVQGIGAADTVWLTVLNYAEFAGSLFTQGSVPTADVNYNMSALFQNIVCDESARATYDNPFKTSKGNYYCNNKSSWCKSSTEFDPDKKQYVMGPSGACGSISYCDVSSECKGDKSTSLSCMSCQAQIQAMQQIIPTYREIARTFVQADYLYRDFYANSYNVENNPDWNFVYQYCADNGINQKKCCIPSVKDHDGNSCNYDSSKAKANFPQVNADSFSSTSDKAVTRLLWPFFMQPAVGNANFVGSASSYYINALESAVVKYIAENKESNLKGEMKDAAESGWILAGSYYYTLAELNNKNYKNSVPDFKVTPASVADQSSNKMHSYRNNFDAADALITKSVNSSSGEEADEGSTGNSGTDKSKQVLQDGLNDMGNAFSGSITSDNTNPLARLQTAGRVLLIVAEIVFIIFLILSVAIALLANISVWVFGTGGTNPAGPGFLVGYFLLVPLLFLLLGIMVTFGGLLGIYTPLIPYIIFTFGAIGWLTSCIETMVAGPLVALGIMSPSHHHKVLGKAEPAMLLLLNNFLRPTLMIFGLVAAILLASVVVTMVNTGMSTVKSMISNGDPLSMIIMLAAYVYIIVAALNKCFAAIHIIPEKVMRWIGGQGESYGEGEAVSEARKGVEAAASGASAYMSEMRSEGKKMGKDAAKSHLAKQGQVKGSSLGDADNESKDDDDKDKDKDKDKWKKSSAPRKTDLKIGGHRASGGGDNDDASDDSDDKGKAKDEAESSPSTSSGFQRHAPTKMTKQQFLAKKQKEAEANEKGGSPSIQRALEDTYESYSDNYDKKFNKGKDKDK